MIAVEEALARLLALVEPLEAEEVPLLEAAGRVLARPVRARRDQPPFATAAMDGYALRADEVRPGAQFHVIGEAAAGRRYSGKIGPTQTVRIFTGAPMPMGADRVIIQEDTARDGDRMTITSDPGKSRHVRPLGADFHAGDEVSAPRRLTSADIALLAAMNLAQVAVTRAPDVALIATGDELVEPGETPGPDQIIASNSYGLHALLRAAGARPRLLPIGRDSAASLRAAFDRAAGADLIVTIGGASVGDHDLVGPVAAALGMERAFYKVAMRPGKPLMAGRLAGAAMIGLPGNPVSAMVCGHVFMLPVIDRMLGMAGRPLATEPVRLAAPLAANGPRQHYMRARIDPEGVAALASQDSALLTVLSAANCLIVRPPADPARAAGEMVQILHLRA